MLFPFSINDAAQLSGEPLLFTSNVESGRSTGSRSPACHIRPRVDRLVPSKHCTQKRAFGNICLREGFAGSQ